MAETLLTTPLTRADLPAIVQRYVAGESLQVIARDAEVHVRTLYRWMLDGLGDKDYEQTVTHCLIDRVAEADLRLELAVDACQIARARETARFARMDFERRRPHLYGQKIESKTDVNITVVVQQLPSTPLPVVVHDIENADVVDK